MKRERATYVLTIEGFAAHGNQVEAAAKAARNIADDVRSAFLVSGAWEPGDVFECRLLRYSPRVGLLDRFLSFLCR